jgi:hypothetical protein
MTMTPTAGHWVQDEQEHYWHSPTLDHWAITALAFQMHGARFGHLMWTDEGWKTPKDRVQEQQHCGGTGKLLPSARSRATARMTR